jgi:hypothetical protein
MKRVWNMIAFLAIVNLLAVGGFVGWLAATDRLSLDRLRTLRETWKVTVAEEKEAEAKVTAESEAAKKAGVEAVRRAGAPESSGQKIEDRRQAQDLLDQQIVRMREEARQLKEQIQSRRDELDKQSAALEAARKDFEQRQAEWKQLAQDEQFQQAVGVLEAQKPSDAMKVLQAILDGGTPPAAAPGADPAPSVRNKKDVVIRYLASMADRSRSKNMAEFIKADEKLAAELLEDLRRRGAESTAAASAAP